MSTDEDQADTPAAAAVLLEIFGRMPPDRRLAIVFELNDAVRGRIEADVRSRHPAYTRDQVRLAAIRLSLGDELFRKVYPGVDIEP